MKSPEFQPNIMASAEKQEAEVFNPDAALIRAQRQIFNQALMTSEGIAGLKNWRTLAKKSKGFRQAVNFFENIAAYDRSRSNNPDQDSALKVAFKEKIGLDKENLSRVEELLACIRAKELDETPPRIRPEVERIFNNLIKSESTEGEVDLPELMSSSAISFGSKAEWFDSRLASALNFLENRDFEEIRQEAVKSLPPEILEQKQNNPEDNVPPPQTDTLIPSMEEMMPSPENEPGAYFKIIPFYGGYYRGSHFEYWNAPAMQWEKAPEKMDDLAEKTIAEKSRRIITGTINPGQKTDLPVPYDFVPDIKTLKTFGDLKINLQTDGQGHFVLDAPAGVGLINFSVEIGRNLTKETTPVPSPLKLPVYKFGEETEKNLREIIKKPASVIDRARELKAYVKNTLQYSNDSRFNQVYRTGSPEDYFARIETHKQADCDVANTYFSALLGRAGIQARLVAGHYVKSKNREKAAVISSGTGHAWVEIWDGASWQRLDATPPGDPNMDEAENDETESETGEGDFGEQDAEILSDEELAELMAEAEKILADKERQRPEELQALHFAEQAGCSPEEAKYILKRIAEVREKRDGQGRLIRSRLAAEWQKIIRDNLVDRSRYTAPIRMSRGYDLADPVEASLDLKAGEGDPTGFSKFEKKTEREQIYGGFDTFLVVDKSGSMSETDSQSGRLKWEDQQVFTFLLMDSLYSAAQEFKKQKIKLISPLDLRTALVSFSSGGAQIELPLGTDWGPKEQFSVWKSLQENVGGGTPDYLGLQTVKEMIEQDEKKNNSVKNRLRLVLVSADGGSDSVSKTIAAKEELKDRGVIVKAAGIGSGAKEVVSTYSPDGFNLKSFADTPDWAAKEVLDQAKELYPKKVKR